MSIPAAVATASALTPPSTGFGPLASGGLGFLGDLLRNSQMTFSTPRFRVTAGKSQADRLLEEMLRDMQWKRKEETSSPTHKSPIVVTQMRPPPSPSMMASSLPRIPFGSLGMLPLR